jgi:LDH2 family malate/lactate/ureidoglycolate dehydrogenase
MTHTAITSEPASIRAAYEDLTAFSATVFAALGLPRERAGAAAEALCHGDLTGISSHGLANLSRLYVPLLESGRADPAAELRIVSDAGAAALVDASRALGLWAAGAAMDIAVERAARHGIGLVSVHNATHFGCAGHHALRAVHSGMLGFVAANCGRQRIARPPGGRLAMLGTNPLALAAPAGTHPPFVLDMSSTVVPAGRVRAAARERRRIPEGWLEDDTGRPVTDPGAFEAGTAHLLWLGGRTETGANKGYGLALLVELLAGLVSGSGLGPGPDALLGDGTPSGQDDDIGFIALAIAPGTLRPAGEFLTEASALFGTLLACPPTDPDQPVRYPGWHEAERARANRRDGVPLSAAVHDELRKLASRLGLPTPIPGLVPIGGPS